MGGVPVSKLKGDYKASLESVFTPLRVYWVNWPRGIHLTFPGKLQKNHHTPSMNHVVMHKKLSVIDQYSV